MVGIDALARGVVRNTTPPVAVDEPHKIKRGT